MYPGGVEGKVFWLTRFIGTGMSIKHYIYEPKEMSNYNVCKEILSVGIGATPIYQ